MALSVGTGDGTVRASTDVTLPRATTCGSTTSDAMSFTTTAGTRAEASAAAASGDDRARDPRRDVVCADLRPRNRSTCALVVAEIMNRPPVVGLEDLALRGVEPAARPAIEGASNGSAIVQRLVQAQSTTWPPPCARRANTNAASTPITPVAAPIVSPMGAVPMPRPTKASASVNRFPRVRRAAQSSRTRSRVAITARGFCAPRSPRRCTTSREHVRRLVEHDDVRDGHEPMKQVESVDVSKSTTTDRLLRPATAHGTSPKARSGSHGRFDLHHVGTEVAEGGREQRRGIEAWRRRAL